MSNSKGFTLVEMMVAAGILAIALAGAMSFFVYQSSKGADATRLRVARENLSLALMLIERDIMAAGYGVAGATTSSSSTKTLSLYINSNYGVDDVTSNTYNSKDTTSTPDKLYVGYGTFLDMNFDVLASNDTNTVFRYSSLRTNPTVQPPPYPRASLPPAPLAAPTNSFVYDLFQYTGMAVTTDTKPLGGFICDVVAGTQAADIDWVATGNPATGTPPWTFKLAATAQLSGNVAPAIVYRIAQDMGHQWANPAYGPTYELQRNGIRIAGGDPNLEVYNLTVTDVGTTAPDIQRSYFIRLDYQVKLGGSQDEPQNHGTAKKTWYKSWVTIQASPRLILLNGG